MSISNTQDTIDSREVVRRIDELRDEWIEATGDDWADYALSEDDWAVGLGVEGAAELAALIALQEQAEGYAPDWRHGATLIRDDHFEDYARQLAEDIGAIDEDARWPACYIDWEAAADALQMDYTSVDFDGITYWIR